MVDPTYAHQEAFCLMKYRSDDGTEEEIIWNSRDGVTPFVLALRSGKMASHVDWRHDICVPDYVPKPGERIFIDLTPERALEIARNNIERWTADGMDMSNAPSAEELAGNYADRPGVPDIMEIT